MDTEIRKNGELLFPSDFENGKSIFFFGFECNLCGEKWFATLGECPRCNKSNFEVLNTQEAAELRYQQLLEDRIHYVFLNGGS
jgi:hypothetical protein